MTKKADTWMPFYVTDYLGDTMHLTTEQHGAYFLLLLACWKADGALPSDDEDLAAITKLPIDRWRRHKDKLLAFFDVVEGGRLVHGRVEKERAKALKIREERSKAGAEGASKLWQERGKTTANEQQNDAPSPSPSSSTKKIARGSRLPKDWEPDQDLITFAEGEGVNAWLERPKFLDYWHAQPGQKGVKLDWSATWRNWCRNAKKNPADVARVTAPPPKPSSYLAEQEEHRKAVEADRIARKQRQTA